ncbi:MAG: N-acetyltransferase family protein [Patescibacteria group bacterium]
MNIRPAKPEDFHTIQELNHFVFMHDAANDDALDTDWPYSPEGEKYYRSLAEGQYGACFIAETDGTAVGYVALAEKDFGYRKVRMLEIENMGVRPEYRGKGIGTVLMQKVREYAREHGYERVYVSAYWKNTSARSFYESCGFVEMGVEYEIEV